MAKVSYSGPTDSGIVVSVELVREPDKDFIPNELGLIVPRRRERDGVSVPVRGHAPVVPWSDVVVALRWALRRSPELRQDLLREIYTAAGGGVRSDLDVLLLLLLTKVEAEALMHALGEPIPAPATVVARDLLDRLRALGQCQSG